MFYAIVPLLLSALGIFATPHIIRSKKGYSTCVKAVSITCSLAAILIVLYTRDFSYSYLFREDSLAFIFSILASFIGFLTILFSTWYVEEHEREYYSMMLLFIASMIGIVLSNNIVLMAVFWEITTLMSFGLVRMKGTKEAERAADRVWMINQIGGIAMLAVAAYTYNLGVYTLDAFVMGGNILAASLMVLAALTKSAIFPFHIWLPSAMEAYSPVSALLHSASMVMAGIYLLIRITPLLVGFVELRAVIMLLGILTIIAASMKAFMEEDIKRVLAYSTLTNIGMMATCISIATPFAIAAALFQVVSHALFKASLFLEAGVYDHSLKTRDINKLIGSIDRLPLTTFFFTLSALSAMGIPITLGFLSKFSMYEATLPIISLFLLFGTVLSLGYYTSVLGFLMARTGGKRIRESWVSLFSIAPLALGSVLAAAYPFPILDECAKAAQELLGVAFIFPALLDQNTLYFSLLLFIGLLIVFTTRKLTIPFRSGEPTRGAIQSPSLQIYSIRENAVKVYSLLNVEILYTGIYNAGSFLSNGLERIRSLIEVE